VRNRPRRPGQSSRTCSPVQSWRLLQRLLQSLTRAALDPARGAAVAASTVATHPCGIILRDLCCKSW
jgi:hypothetical protein